MSILWTILKILGGGILAALLGFIIYFLIKEFMFKFMKPNKWIMVVLLIAAVIAPFPLEIKFVGFTGRILLPTLYIALVLCTIDSFGVFEKAGMSEKEKQKIEKEKNDIIRPKAKPNRAKHLKK